MKPEYVVGLIADTHGLLRPEALAALRGSDFILHAGDIGDPAILEALTALAPVVAVRGNNDVEGALAELPERAELRLGAARILLLHDLKALDADESDGFQAVVSGHSHRPRCERRGAVLFVNPGSAGARRFKLPIAAGRLRVQGSELSAELFELLPRPVLRRS